MTGGAGYLGIHLIEILLNNGSEVVLIDDFSTGRKRKLLDQVEIIQDSIVLRDSFAKIPDPKRIDGAFHLGALKSVSQSLLQPSLYHDVNVKGTQNLVYFCKQNLIENIVFTSSAAVYGSLDLGRPILENDATMPINPYGETKKKAEKIISEFASSNNNRGSILRCFNLAGSTASEYIDIEAENLIPVVLRAAKNSAPLRVFGHNLKTFDGSCVRDYIHVQDAASVHYLTMLHLLNSQSNTFEILNVASGNGTSVLQMVRKFEEYLDINLHLSFEQPREGDPISSIGSIDKIKSILKWKPAMTLEQIVKSSLNAIKN